jgi:hypothetical protein
MLKVILFVLITIGMSLSYTNIVRALYDQIETHLIQLKTKDCNIEKPMLHYFRLRNLINTYTDILGFLLSFPIPFEQKTHSINAFSQSVGKATPSKSLDGTS